MASAAAQTGNLLNHQPKANTACARMEELAHRLGPEAKLPRVKELCGMLDVSPVTLTKALDELERRGVIYRIQGHGIFVSPRVRRGILLICDPSFMRGASHSPFWDLLMEYAHSRGQTQNREISYHFALPPTLNGAPLHQGLMEEISSKSAAGVLGVGLSLNAAEWVEAQGVPFVALAGPAKHMVALDTPQLIHCCVRELAAQGCRRIGLWSDVPPHRAHSFRSLKGLQRRWIEAFQAILEEIGLPFEDSLVQNNYHLITCDGDRTSLSTQEQGYQTVQRIWGPAHIDPDGLRPDGIVITNDLMTHGALAAFKALNVKLGRDVVIASHATKGSPILMECESEITLVEYDPSEVARAMLDMLELLIDGTPAPSVVSIVPQIRKSRPS